MFYMDVKVNSQAITTCQKVAQMETYRSINSMGNDEKEIMEEKSNIFT